MKVQVDQGLCREYANCVMESPDVFDLDPVSGKVVALVAEPADDLAAEVRAAAASCPVRAITVFE